MKTIFTLLFAATLGCIQLHAQKIFDGKAEIFSSRGIQLEYRLHLSAVEPGVSMPFLLILQEKNSSRDWNQLLAQDESIKKQHPLVLVAEIDPMLTDPDKTRSQTSGILDLLDQILSQYPVDFAQIYLIGESGVSALCRDLLLRRQGFFAAVLLCGEKAAFHDMPMHSATQITIVPQKDRSISQLFTVRQRIFTTIPIPSHYDVVALSAHGFSAKILPQAGGNLFSLRHIKSGTPLLREPHRPEELFHTPERFGMPILFPPNRIADGTFTFEGKKYHLPVNLASQGVHIHGVAFNKSWEVTRQGDDFVELRLIFDDAAPEYAGFSFPFEIVRRYELTPHGMRDIVAIQNLGDKNMPLGLGFHTAFPAQNAVVRMGIADGELEIDPISGLPTGKCIPWEKTDPRQAFNPFAQNLHFHAEAALLPLADSTIHGAEIIYPAGILRYETDEKFAFWDVWNGGGFNDFLCLEPISWMTDALNSTLPASRTRLRKLAPKEKVVFTNQIVFLPSKQE